MLKEELLDGFEVSQLKPFGTEIRSKNGIIDAQKWITSSLDDVTELVRRQSLVVIRNTYPFQENECNPISAPEKTGSSSMFHVDQRGTVDILVWQASGPDRADTQFVQSQYFKRKSRELLPMIDSIRFELGHTAWIDPLKEVLESADSDPESFEPNHIHTVFRRLVIDKRIRDRMPRNSRGIIDKIIRALFVEQTVKEEVREALSNDQNDRIQRLIASYSSSLNEALGEYIYSHQWSEKSDSVVIAYNKIDEEVNTDTTVYHRGVPSEKKHHNILYRSEVKNGVLQPSPTHGFH